MPRPLFDGTYAHSSEIIAADPRPVRVLNLPFGVRDGTSSLGNFGARSLFEQTRHGKALIGGYLSRVSERRRRTMVEAFPELAALLDLSEGRPCPARRGAGCFRRARGSSNGPGSATSSSTPASRPARSWTSLSRPSGWNR